jgi:selenocysteine-specific elongation factor
MEALFDLLRDERFSPPALNELKGSFGEELAEALIARGDLVQVGPEIVFRRADYDEMVGAVREMIVESGAVTVAAFRDRFRTSRKYALAVLEHLDAIGMTIREGDQRRLHPSRAKGPGG